MSLSYDQSLAVFQAEARRTNGTVMGAGLGAFASFLEREDVRASLEKDDKDKVVSVLNQVVMQVNLLAKIRRPSDMPAANDFISGLLAGRPVNEGGGAASHPVALTVARAQSYSWPPFCTEYQRPIDALGNPILDAQGKPLVTVSRLGQLADVGLALSTPEVAAALGGLVLSAPPTAAQLAAILSYFQALMAAAAGVAAAGGVIAWIAANSPALADPALDVAWPVTSYNSGTLTASAANTSAGLGAIVAGAQGTAVFKYNYNQEQQTARSFRLQVTPTTTAGTQFSAYLPQALRNNGAPKVHLQVEGSVGPVAAGSPYVSAAVGGATPYFTVSTATNPSATTAFNLVCMVTN